MALQHSQPSRTSTNMNKRPLISPPRQNASYSQLSSATMTTKASSSLANATICKSNTSNCLNSILHTNNKKLSLPSVGNIAYELSTNDKAILDKKKNVFNLCTSSCHGSAVIKKLKQSMFI